MGGARVCVPGRADAGPSAGIQFSHHSKIPIFHHSGTFADKLTIFRRYVYYFWEPYCLVPGFDYSCVNNLYHEGVVN